MELFRFIMELAGSCAMLVVAVAMWRWGPIMLSAIRATDKRNLDNWAKHFEYEVKKYESIIEHMERTRMLNAKEEDMN